MDAERMMFASTVKRQQKFIYKNGEEIKNVTKCTICKV
jgi:hypothetical protein